MGRPSLFIFYLTTPRTSNLQLHPDIPKSIAMSELLSFILDHEDSFKNRARLSSLWSDFPLHKVANPDGYAANINAWKKALFHASRAGHIPATAGSAIKKGVKESGTNDVLIMATGQQLARALEYRPWGIPSGLASVVVSCYLSYDI